MAIDKKTLQKELNELQNFINACEFAQSHRLGLDEVTFDKYNNAIEREKEIGEALKAIDESPHLLKTTVQFKRKEPEMKSSECIVEKVVELGKYEFDSFSKQLLDDYDFIIDNKDAMYVDDVDVTHALLVIGEGHEDGILVDAQGSSYARYSALLPNAKTILRQYQLAEDKGLTLWDLMSCKLEDVHIVDLDEEHDLATIVELDQHTLTEQGKTDWEDVLSAKVRRIYEGYYGTQIEVTGCAPERLKDFSEMLAGYCSFEEYNSWVVDSQEARGSIPTQPM